jgi:HSP20 family protein
MYHFELAPTQKRRQHWEKELEKFFDVFSREDYFAPSCEILDEERFYSIGLDIPGLKREALDIEVRDNHLHISGERKSLAQSEKRNVLRSERRYGKFERIFSLPQNVNAEAIEAHFEDGVLQIILPKEEKSQSKKITISAQKTDSSELKN